MWERGTLLFRRLVRRVLGYSNEQLPAEEARNEPVEPVVDGPIDPVVAEPLDEGAPLVDTDPTPALRAEHVAGARLFATRQDMVQALGIPARAVISEIGVAEGNFSEFLLETLDPSVFVAFDLFDLHVSMTKYNELFAGRTHQEFYSDRLDRFRDRTEIEIHQGDSSANLRAITDKKFDMIYIDGDHRLEGVIRDMEASIPLLKDGGILIFNDYIIHDYYANMRYGVVEVVNDLCVNHGWRVAGFALQKGMFCDIALVRS